MNQNMDKVWPHELNLTCLGHQVTIVRLEEQVTQTRPAAMLQTPNICGAGAHGC